MFKREQLFEQWLSGTLSAEQQAKAEQELTQDPLWADRVNAARRVNFEVSTAPIRQVPDWDRASAFESDVRPWWQWQGIPAMSMAFSCFALALVIFKVEFNVNENGMLVSFGGGSDQQRIAQMVDEKLLQFSQQQQVTLANHSVEQVNKQQQSNLQLATYILETSRQERKEDISDFISYFNEQRKEDQSLQRIKLRQLEDTINYQTNILSNQEPSLQPASWRVEE
ncbi:hypothetical protein [Thalassotalea atypica]|uniref:hypothetical protein n=1 Tax=Thalassotalea atypica TaxID=2054316 RepID=UPI00257222E0|nr:hypothetical protein [Thalassotalea atypica]